MSNKIIKIDGFELENVADDGELRVRDVDLAERAGLAQPRNVRQLIDDNRAEIEENGPITVRTRSVRIEKRGAVRGVEERDVAEYWLTEAQAYNVVALMGKAPLASKLRPAMARAFVAARRQAQDDARRSRPIWDRLIDAILMPKPAEWEAMFSDSLVRELCRLDKIAWIGGSHPRHLASTNAKIYDSIFSSPVGREMRARNPQPVKGRNHHQHLTPEAREYLRKQLPVVEAIARGSASKGDFWDRMERGYGGGMLQLSTGAA